MSEAKEYSKSIKAEADRLLQVIKLFTLLEEFGNVDLGGSYQYDLMVERDLDFGVAVQSVNPELRGKIAETFARQPWAYSVNMTDRVNFEPQSNFSAPRGLFLGLTIPFPEERWNIDVWFIVGEELPHDEIGQLLANATEEQRNTILQIKYDLMKSGQSVKGQTSTNVYKAVIKNNIRTTEEYLEYNI